MELNIETQIALFGLCITSVFSVAGLFLNFLALRQSNRLAISSKLAEASQILSDELVSVSRAKQLLKSELVEAEKHPDSVDKAKKVSLVRKIRGQFPVPVAPQVHDTRRFQLHDRF